MGQQLPPHHIGTGRQLEQELLQHGCGEVRQEQQQRHTKNRPALGGIIFLPLTNPVPLD